jgi:D-alanine-D-alanine ligase
MKLAILFGGRSGEHEISIRSTRSILDAIDKNKYQITLIGIDKTGSWGLSNRSLEIKSTSHPLEIAEKHLKDIDVVFPVLHGNYGEDGSIQGFFETLNIAYVGTSVLGSAIGMDKEITKRILKESQIPIVDFLVLREKPSFGYLKDRFSLPFFIKPASEGSSLGVSKVSNFEEFEHAYDLAYSYGEKVLVEKAVIGREIECAVIGNKEVRVSLPGEFFPKGGVYSYENKYLNPDGAIFQLPANLPMEKVDEVRSLAKKAYIALCQDSMARVDFFMDDDFNFYLNEINTIPGFTSISLYPKMWEISGLSFKDLIDELISLALERGHKNDLELPLSFKS